MNLHRITPRQWKGDPPAPEGWTAFWHGYFQMNKVRSPKKKAKDKKTHAAPKDAGPKPISETEVESQCLLNMVAEIDSDEVSMFELGAGRGDWCLALAGVVDHKLIDCRASRVRCLAVEGEPTHYEWTREHFDAQNIAGEAVHGVVYSTNGTLRFLIESDPADNYGQSVRGDGQIEVPAYTVDTLAERHGFDHVHIFHMDVQGAEVHALLGARETLLRGSPDYFIIGTHGPMLNREIRYLLEPLYEFPIDFPPRAGVVATPFGAANLPADGIMIARRRKSAGASALASFRRRWHLIRFVVKFNRYLRF